MKKQLHNGKVKMHVKNGDIVKIIAGYDKGKIGTIIKILRKTNQVIVKDINIKTKHVRPQREGETGNISREERPIHSSNVMLYDSTKQIASRTRKVQDANGKYERTLIKLTNTN
uniref:Large ribosomal subunit protein uL24c n=1 Tax=Scinaia undulata TaxID=1884664 RepID=A0A1G4NXM4_9FLOR|nr:Ribosomal protein L24 [Scinaia undulata]SCW23441.1 Ribosomal protein L24 [Scinaia undulata]